jgi:hypothetical protein
MTEKPAELRNIKFATNDKLTFGRTKASDNRAPIKDDFNTKINQRMVNNGRRRIKKAQLIDNNEVLGALQK